MSFSHLVLTIDSEDILKDILFQWCLSNCPMKTTVHIKPLVIGQSLKILFERPLFFYLQEAAAVETDERTEARDEQDDFNAFIRHNEYDALQSAIAVYLGAEREGIDKDRCQIDSIRWEGDQQIVSFYLLPPKEFKHPRPYSP